MSGYEAARTLLASIAYNILHERPGCLTLPKAPEHRRVLVETTYTLGSYIKCSPLEVLRQHTRAALAVTQYALWESRAGRADAVQVAKNCVETALEVS